MRLETPSDHKQPNTMKLDSEEKLIILSLFILVPIAWFGFKMEAMMTRHFAGTSDLQQQIQDLTERVEHLEQATTKTSPLTLNPEGIDYRAAGIR